MGGKAGLADFVPLFRIISMDDFDRKLRRFLVDEGYLFPITDAEIERALKEVETMSAHNHDEQIMKRFGTNTAKELQKKSDDSVDEKIKQAILSADISGLSRDDAIKKLKNAVDSLFE